jgi:hypothetical protein
VLAQFTSGNINFEYPKAKLRSVSKVVLHETITPSGSECTTVLVARFI